VDEEERRSVALDPMLNDRPTLTDRTAAPQQMLVVRRRRPRGFAAPSDTERMSMRLSPVLACLLAVLALPAAASADDGSDGYDTEEQYYPGYYDQTAYDGQDWPDGGGQDPALPVVPPDLPTAPVAPVVPALPTVPATTGTVKGTTAMLRTDGKAAVPRAAPARVRAAIAAANEIVGKPYKWGGGHAKLVDSGYDCSGAVSYSLIGATVLGGTMVSGTLAHWALQGEGRWLTVYANKDHVYMEVAGLRFDTSAAGDPVGGSGVRWRPLIGRRTGFHARHVAGL
jgi:cell wall-associated NlpC family hydrolase